LILTFSLLINRIGASSFAAGIASMAENKLVMGENSKLKAIPRKAKAPEFSPNSTGSNRKTINSSLYRRKSDSNVFSRKLDTNQQLQNSQYKRSNSLQTPVSSSLLSSQDSDEVQARKYHENNSIGRTTGRRHSTVPAISASSSINVIVPSVKPQTNTSGHNGVKASKQITENSNAGKPPRPPAITTSATSSTKKVITRSLSAPSNIRRSSTSGRV
jgi:hypothetical protein